jgi:DNA transformation protein and related proteins
MAVQAQYLAYVLEQLAGLGNVSTRRMFGGVGLYAGELFFGLIDDDTLFFKTDESNAAEYQARRMPRFMPPANRPLGPMGYHQVPAEIIEDGESLVVWARKAVAVALSAQAKKARKPRRVKATSAPIRKKTARKKVATRKTARAKPLQKR